MPTNDTEISILLNDAMALVERDPARTMQICTKVRALAPANLVAHNMLEQLNAPDCYGRWMRINCRIDPRDDIFHFFSRHPLAGNPIREYLSDGWRTLSELMLLLEEAGVSLTDMQQVLEFASGYGRFTRHLVKAIPGRVDCSDVLPGTAEFLREQFAVNAFYSSHNPREIEYPKQYDMVFVLSLFTHLPVNMWTPWLQNLARGIRPGGLLVFSVHNEAAATQLGVNFGDDGSHFVASSESPSLDGAVYGTTFTTRAFVEQAVVSALGSPVQVYRPCAFWEGQDGVVVRIA
ncbi:MAG: class I SAM-dependent methyltransferase [Betaproteobacteria bacterium]|nr:class I SAM-dependent methyltransferase [Betaproteobacteria bacterium]